MTTILHNPPNIFPPYRCYAHAAEVSAGSRTLYISGLNGFHVDGKTMPESFEEQAELIWQHMGSHRVAWTVVCSQLLDPRWKLEVEAVAAE
jgi:2-iminobutanoate/2-iminopropanoate deaminase